jgi:hypothetical protein
MQEKADHVEQCVRSIGPTFTESDYSKTAISTKNASY